MFDGEIAVQCVMFVNPARGEFPPGRGGGGARAPYRIWRDGLGGGALDGDFQAGEFQDCPIPGWAGCQVFDSRGDLWRLTGGKIARIAFQGLDKNGVPVFGADQVTTYERPPEMSGMARVEYEAEKDSLFLFGPTKERPSPDKDVAGTEILRYDTWSKAPVLRSRMIMPEKGNQNWIVAISVCGDWVFAGERYGQRLNVYDSRTGERVTRLVPGPDVGGPEWYGGGLDCPQSVRAYRRKNGEILIFTEEVSYAKVLMHQWMPPATSKSVMKE
jgi:hypothetical protein